MSTRPITQFISLTSTSNGVLIPLEYMGGAFQCSVQIVQVGTGSCQVAATLDPVNDFISTQFTPNDNSNSNGLYTAPATLTSGHFLLVSGLALAAAGTVQSNLAFPATALAFTCTATGTGYAVIRVIQTAVAQ